VRTDPFTGGLAKAGSTGKKQQKSACHPADLGKESLAMNPLEKQFSLNRGASKKQFPISISSIAYQFSQFSISIS